MKSITQTYSKPDECNKSPTAKENRDSKPLPISPSTAGRQTILSNSADHNYESDSVDCLSPRTPGSGLTSHRMTASNQPYQPTIRSPRHALHETSAKLTQPSFRNQQSTVEMPGSSPKSSKVMRVSRISGNLNKYTQAITFHYADGTESVYTSPNSIPSDQPPTEFRLHAEEHIVGVRYRHKLAALKQNALGCGIEFETSFGRSLILCSRPDSFFAWGRDCGTKREWRASPGRCVVGLCLDAEWDVDESGALTKVRILARRVNTCARALGE